jgi:hypothetical protein
MGDGVLFPRCWKDGWVVDSFMKEEKRPLLVASSSGLCRLCFCALYFLRGMGEGNEGQEV